MEKLKFDQLSEQAQRNVFATIKSYSDSIPANCAELLKRVNILEKNGYVKGEHFEYNYDLQISKQKAYEGIGFFEFEVSYLTPNIKLLVNRFNKHSNKIDIEEMFLTWWDEGLIRCSLTETKRYCKPKTMLEKLKVHNSRQEFMFKRFSEETTIVERIMESYRLDYPTATVTTHENYNHRANSYSADTPIIQLRFPTGSMMEIAIKLDNPESREIIKIKDGSGDWSLTKSILAYFNQQEPCGVEATA
jgi:hypothetical protein